jgi:hypothetical protein
MMQKPITSEKAFIEKVKEGYKLERYKGDKLTYYYLTNYSDTEITVSKRIMDKLKAKGIVDWNWDINLSKLGLK